MIPTARRLICLGILWHLSAYPIWANDDAIRSALKQRQVQLQPAQGPITMIRADVATWTPDDFKILAECTAVRKLSLSGRGLNDQTLPLLAPLQQLEEFSTNATNLSDTGYRHFAAFKKLRTLALFHPWWNRPGFTGAGLKHLQGLSALRELTFAGATAGDEALEAVGTLGQLETFRTWHTRQTAQGNQHLLKLTKLKTLKLGQRLPHRQNPPPSPSLDANTLALLAKMPALEKIEITEARLQADDFRPLQQLTTLREMKIHITDIPDTDVQRLRTMFPKCRIQHIPLTPEQKKGTLDKKLRLYAAG